MKTKVVFLLLLALLLLTACSNSISGGPGDSLTGSHEAMHDTSWKIVVVLAVAYICVRRIVWPTYSKMQ